MKTVDVGDRLRAALLGWIGLDSFMERLLRLAYELRGRVEDAQEVFCLLQAEGYLQLRAPAEMPRGGSARHYRCVGHEELLLARARLASRLFVIGPALAEFVIRDCLSCLRQMQAGREVFPERLDGESRPPVALCVLYQALTQVLSDCSPGVDQGLWGELQRACGELRDPADQAACRDLVGSLR